MSVSEKLGIKKSNFIGLVVVALAVVYGIIQFVLNLVNGVFLNNTHASVIISVAIIVIYALILFFTFWGYKIPNGKLLKYIYLLFALRLAITAGQSAASQNNVLFILGISAVIITAFIAGRLPKVNENKYNCAVLLAILLAISIMSSVLHHAISINIFVQGLALVACYFARAGQYKENSGILDDK